MADDLHQCLYQGALGYVIVVQMSFVTHSVNTHHRRTSHDSLMSRDDVIPDTVILPASSP